MRVSSWTPALRMTSLLAVIFLTGCATGPTVRVDQDAAAYLSRYRTFGFYDRSKTDMLRCSTIASAWLIEIQAARESVSVTVLREGRAIEISAIPGR